MANSCRNFLQIAPLRGHVRSKTSSFFAYNILNPVDLPKPILDGAIDLGLNVVGAGGLIGFDYAVLHYGKGSGGVGQGGGVAFYSLNGATSFTFPAIGRGPNGLGEFSTLTLFKGDGVAKGVPDGGATVGLLGMALGLIAVARRRFGV